MILRVIFVDTHCHNSRSVSIKSISSVNTIKQSNTTSKRCDGEQQRCLCLILFVMRRNVHCVLTAFVLFASAGMQAHAANDMAMADIDTATTQSSEKGVYKVVFESVAGPIEINTIHEWLLTVLASDGTPVDGLTIAIDGGMPMHDHGLPTAPRVTESLGDGQYRVEGVKFQMPGHWTMTFDLADDKNVSDSVTFNLML